MDSKTQMLEKMVRYLVAKGDIAGAEKVLIAAQETHALPDSILTKISSENGLGLRWYHTA